MFTMRAAKRSADQGFSLIEVMVAIMLATMLGSLLLAMVLATQKQFRAYQVQTDTSRENVAFDAAFQASFNTVARVRLVGSAGTGLAPNDRNQVLFDFTTVDKNGATVCAAMSITHVYGKPYPAAPAAMDYMTWRAGYYGTAAARIPTCGAAAVKDVAVEWATSTNWQGRPITFSFFDATGADMTSDTATGWDVANYDQPNVNSRIAKVSYTRLRSTGGSNTITSGYAMKPAPSAGAGSTCTRPDTDWMPLPGLGLGGMWLATPFEFRVFQGAVQLHGGASGSGGGINTITAQLPVDYWPADNYGFTQGTGTVLYTSIPNFGATPMGTVSVTRGGAIRFPNQGGYSTVYRIDSTFPLSCKNTRPDTDWMPLPGVNLGGMWLATPFEFRVFQGAVQLRGGASGSGGGINTITAQLPADYWPADTYGYYPGEGTILYTSIPSPGATPMGTVSLTRGGAIRFPNQGGYSTVYRIDSTFPLS